LFAYLGDSSSVVVFLGVLAYPLQMRSKKYTVKTRDFGFTLIELLVVIAIIVILMSLLIPALSRAFGTAKSTEDKTRLKGIYGAFVLDASGNEGKLPVPSEYIKDYPDAVHDMTDTTANLMSMLLARNYFTTDFLISPVESNPNIKDINQDDLVYDYESIDGEEVFWDDQFAADVANATAVNPAHNSYAHQALCGQRVRLKWNTTAGPSDIILWNRGPEMNTDGSSIETTSHTFKFHGEESIWKGNIAAGDGSVRMIDSFIPEEIAYQPLNGMPLGPDNIFTAEWAELDPAGTDGMPSGDNWMVICTEVLSDDAITASWD